MVAELLPCTSCGRCFSSFALKKHVTHCSQPKKVVKFNARFHYLVDTPSEGFLRSVRVAKSKLGRSKLRVKSSVASLRLTSVSSKLASSLTPEESISKKSRGIDILEFLGIAPKTEDFSPIGLHPLEQERPKTAERKFLVPQFSSAKKSVEKKPSRYDKAAEAVKAKGAARETMLSSRRS